jgi:hypothetical protein
MKTRALAVLLPLLALSGCTEGNGVSVQVFALCAAPENCEFTSNECNQVFIGENLLDLNLTDTYSSYVEVHNNTANNADDSVGRPNTHDAYVEEYSVSYEVNGGAAPASVVRRVASGPVLVPADGGSQVVTIFPVPSDVGAQLGGATQVVARVRLRGFLADQSRWETAEFPIPIELCAGCVGLPAACSDPTQSLFVCPQVGQTPFASFCE